MNTSISRDEWLKALVEAGCHAGEHDEQALTIAEFATMMNLPEGTAKYQLAKLVTAGKAIRTRKRGMTNNGRRLSFIAYRLVP